MSRNTTRMNRDSGHSSRLDRDSERGVSSSMDDYLDDMTDNWVTSWRCRRSGGEYTNPPIRGCRYSHGFGAIFKFAARPESHASNECTEGADMMASSADYTSRRSSADYPHDNWVTSWRFRPSVADSPTNSYMPALYGASPAINLERIRPASGMSHTNSLSEQLFRKRSSSTGTRPQKGIRVQARESYDEMNWVTALRCKRSGGETNYRCYEDTPLLSDQSSLGSSALLNPGSIGESPACPFTGGPHYSALAMGTRHRHGSGFTRNSENTL